MKRGMGRLRLLEAAMTLVRQKGFAATSVDDLCAAAGVTKGAFFHHFATKDDLGVAMIDHWTDTTAAMFAAADYNHLPDPVDRLFAYLDLRRTFLDWPVAAFSCVGGTTVQEVWASHPAMRAAAGRCMVSGMDHVLAHLQAALLAHPVDGITAEGLARQFQVAVQGGIIVAKALDDPSAAREAFDHLDHYLHLLFARPPKVPARQ
jgi:TetR/AcrR family transcriptional regulator, transcriptional repressor for nem operon